MKTLAIYPGSFNPFHIGHLNIVEKAQDIFGVDNVLVAIGNNPFKMKKEKFSISKFFSRIFGQVKDKVSGNEAVDRALHIKNSIGVETETYDTFLHEFVEKKESEGYNVVVIRGLRNGADLDYEVNQMRFINDFNKNIKVVYITCDLQYEHISSSSIRVMDSFRKGSGDRYKV